MALSLTDDIDAILNVDEFATSATHTNEFDVSATVYGIFDNDYFSVDTGVGSVSMAETNPRFLGKTSAFTDIKYGDELEIDGVTWIIREIMPDGTGMTELTLERQ
jgi:hypothetical protein